MGTFVTDPTSELFADKESAPGLVLRPGWTEANVFTADNANAVKGAADDLRTAHLALAATVASASSVGSAAPQPVAASAVVGIATAASREDHVHAHGNQLGGSLHADVSGTASGFMTTAQKAALEAAASSIASLSSSLSSLSSSLSSVNTQLQALDTANSQDVSLGTPSGLALVGQVLSLALADSSNAGALSSAGFTKLAGIASGATAGITALAAVGAVPNANAASISSTTLTLQPANASFPGLMSSSDFTKVAGLSAAVTPALSVAVAALPSTLQMSTEGTIDWWHPNGNTTQPMPLTTAGTGNKRKVRGEGDAFRTFAWIPAVGANIALTNGDLAFPVTTTATDCVTNAALSAYPNGTYCAPSSTQIGHGFTLQVRASTTSRTLRVYMGRNVCDVAYYAQLTGGSTTASGTILKATGTPTVFQLGQMVTITFTASTPGQMLTVEFKASVSYGAASTVNFMGITLA